MNYNGTLNGWSIFWGVVLGILTYLVANVVLADWVAGLLGIVVAAAIIVPSNFGSRRV